MEIKQRSSSVISVWERIRLFDSQQKTYIPPFALTDYYTASYEILDGVKRGLKKGVRDKDFFVFDMEPFFLPSPHTRSLHIYKNTHTYRERGGERELEI